MRGNSSVKARMLGKKKSAKKVPVKPSAPKKASLKNAIAKTGSKVGKAIKILKKTKVSWPGSKNRIKPRVAAVRTNRVISRAKARAAAVPVIAAPKAETARPERARFIEERYSLPWRYGDDRIVLLPRDPWWIFTYWDITQARIDAVVAAIPEDERRDLRWVLRVHDVTGVDNFNGGNSNSYFDIDIYFDATNWYLNVDKPGCGWCVEIGFLSRSGRFYMVARSNVIRTPRFGVSQNIDEEWALPDEDYYKLLGMYDLGRSSISMKKRFEEIARKQLSSQMASFNISSPGARVKEQDRFFLEVWTELILHGRTTPDATVTVEGKKVDLRADGTFTLRYALPVGDYRFQVAGVSKNRKHRITKTPAVKRFEK